MALFIEYSPAVQEVRGSIPGWDATFPDALCKGCRWFWSSLYIVVTRTWCTILTQRHAFGWISMRTLHATESHSAMIPNCDWGGAVAAQVRSQMATKYGRSNSSFHRVLACSAGGPGFDFGWDATFSDALCKGCRWFWSSLYKDNFWIWDSFSYTAFHILYYS